MGIFSGVFGDSEKESKTEINVVNVYEDKNNPQGRKIAGDAVLQLLENNEFSAAAETAQKYAGAFGDEFTYFYLPVSNFFKKLKNVTGDVYDLENGEDFKFGADLAEASKRMPADFKLTEEQAQSLVKTIDKLKKNQKNEHKPRYDLYKRTKSNKQVEEMHQIENYLTDGCSAIFVYKCVAENFASYKGFKDFRVGLGLTAKDFAIPGPDKSDVSSKFSFMKSLSDMPDAKGLFSVYTLICGYQTEKKNTVSVSGGLCSASINLNNGFLFFAKNCKIRLSFSGEKTRLFSIKGKINVKKSPELLEKSKSFKMWKEVEGKPAIKVDFSLKNEEFKQKMDEIPEIAKTIDSENAEIKSILTAK